MKDYFSTQSKLYATFRPTYPKELYEFLFSHVKERKVAWDCATGNGQVACYLSKNFGEVYGTDISTQQLDQAAKEINLFYSVSPAEKTSFPENQFDLITVAQALHWFDRESFYAEATRVGKPGSVIAAWGYALLYIDPIIDEVIMDFYNHTVGLYWDSARKLIEEHYQTISFPFEEIKAPRFSIKVQWSINQFSGYLSSWSATQKYIKEKGHDPVYPFIKRLKKYWTKPEMTVTFPLFMRLGIISK
jgi:ubiquinone/menaquinone biosynthesis C-methylase UbiE